MYMYVTSDNNIFCLQLYKYLLMIINFLYSVLKQAMRSGGGNITETHAEELSVCALFLMEASKKRCTTPLLIRLSKGHYKTKLQNYQVTYNPIDDTTLTYLSPPEDTRTQRIYFLKKIHKTPHGLRPIVSGINGPTEKISSFIDHFLKPTLSTIPSLLNNTQELIQILNTTPIPKDALLLTIDVSNLYLNIPQEEGTEACLSAMELNNSLPLPNHT